MSRLAVASALLNLLIAEIIVIKRLPSVHRAVGYCNVCSHVLMFVNKPCINTSCFSFVAFKVGLYGIRLVRILCDATPVVMLSPEVAMKITSQRDASCR